MKGILPDINAIGPVAILVQRMQTPPWDEFWKALGLELKTFADVGLVATSSDATSGTRVRRHS